MYYLYRIQEDCEQLTNVPISVQMEELPTVRQKEMCVTSLTARELFAQIGNALWRIRTNKAPRP